MEYSSQDASEYANQGARQHGDVSNEVVQLPAPTAWPVVLALGLTLCAAGMVIHVAVSVLGALLVVRGCFGWFREVLPHQHHEAVPVVLQAIPIVSTRTAVSRIQVDESHRAQLPLEAPPVLAGVKGGIAGGVAMIIPALLYGLISYHSIWYPVNLLGGAGVANWQNATTAEIAAFHWRGLLAATVIHIVSSLLVGLVYGAMLPMLPRRPIVLGGLVAPVLWTGLLHSTLVVINPFLDQRIEWKWFLVSQVAYGLVAGWVVSKQARIRRQQDLPFAARLGLETPGLMPEHGDGEQHGERRP